MPQTITLLVTQSIYSDNPHMLQLPPLALYIHIPWCVKKCPYCDFNSHEPKNTSGGKRELPEAAYLQALEEDLRDSAQYAQGRTLDSIFFGGGTPSIVSGATIAACIEMADRLVGISPNAEITMEANPGTFEQEKFRDFRAAGVNRLSIGIQTFHPEHLTALGRIHNRQEAIHACDIAREAGFNNINLDLMHGLPQQTHSDAIADLQQAIALEPNHISWYELTIEPNTTFYSNPPRLPSENILSTINDEGMALLNDQGYSRYEISAYAKTASSDTQAQTASTWRSRHNMNYWEFGDYLGIGAGAHEKMTLLSEQHIIRRSKTRLPEHYIQRIGSRVASQSTLNKDTLAFEFCMNALRLIDGVSTKIFETRTGRPIAELQHKLTSSVEGNLLEPIQQQIRPTQQGVLYLNTLLEELLPSD